MALNSEYQFFYLKTDTQQFHALVYHRFGKISTYLLKVCPVPLRMPYAFCIGSCCGLAFRRIRTDLVEVRIVLYWGWI